MTWVRLDDGFYDHPKITRIGLAAAGLFVNSLCYSARQLTDGFIPTAALAGLASGKPGKLPQLLIKEGLWEAVDGGYRIHDYLDYNPSREKVLARRTQLHAARADAGRRGGLVGVQRNGHVESAPTPEPAAPLVEEGEANAKQNRSKPGLSKHEAPAPARPRPGPRNTSTNQHPVLVSAGHERAKRAPPALEKTLTVEFQDALVTEFAPQLGGEEVARKAIAKALNHPRSKTWLNACKGLRDWLEEDVARYRATGTEHRTNGRATPQPGGGHAGVAEQPDPYFRRIAARGRGAD
jgi:hypothetical protein